MVGNEQRFGHVLRSGERGRAAGTAISGATIPAIGLVCLRELSEHPAFAKERAPTGGEQGKQALLVEAPHCDGRGDVIRGCDGHNRSAA